MDKLESMGSINRVILRMTAYLIVGFIYWRVVVHFIPNPIYSTLFLISSLICFIIIGGVLIMKGKCSVDACEGQECPYNDTCDYDNWYIKKEQKINIIHHVKKILESDRCEMIKDSLLGEHRQHPCKKCGNPYHQTDEHRWYH